MGALALVAISAASFVYLRPNLPLATHQSPSGPPAHPAFASLNPVTYDFVTPAVGWAVDNIGTPAVPATGFRIFKTTDGAKHWQKQLELESSAIGYLPFSVQFLDQKHGFVAVGDPFEQLERTTDGVNWDSIPLPAGSARIDTIAFSSATYGWLLVGGPALYVTTDGGSTWQRLPDPPYDADRLSFRSPAEAWMGSRFTGLTPPHLYESTDAGQTWRRVELPAPPGRSWDSHPSAGVEILPRSGVIASIPPVRPELVAYGLSLIAVSMDRGSSWRYVSAPPGVVAFQDSWHWWAMEGVSLYKSSDAGQTWTLAATQLPDWQYVPHVLDARHAWALLTVIGGYGLGLTNDGGFHWTRGAVPQPS